MRTHNQIKQASYRLQIDASLEAFFVDNVNKAFLVNAHYANLWKALQTLNLSGGKRLRPQITLMAYEAFGGTDIPAILPVATAQELIHLAMLIHDDIIDRDYVRHGVDNIAGTYNKLYATLVGSVEDRTHYAQSAALLAGDLLISASYQLITTASIIPQKIIAMQHLLGTTIFEVAGGELLDTESAFYNGEISAEIIAYYKTASYTFISPLMAGAVLANASKEDQTLLRVFAENLGIAYQFTDDIISVFGDESKTGKSTTSDIREGKRTYLVEQFYLLASNDEIKQFESYFGKQEVTTEGIEKVRHLLIATGSKAKTEESINTHIELSRAALINLGFNEEYNKKFNDLIILSTKRDC
jgi:geranylgeranyl diphosphate synthase type II